MNLYVMTNILNALVSTVCRGGLSAMLNGNVKGVLTRRIVDGYRPGMFKCKNSSICISSYNLCDDFPDCSTGEDEHFCPSGDNILQPCPLKCSCLLFSVFCKKNSIEWENLALNQITIHLTQSQLPKDRAFLASFDKSFILILRHSKLLFICEQVISLIYIQLLDIPNNLIKHISNNCFQRMNMIRHLTLSFNRISVVSKTNHYF